MNKLLPLLALTPLAIGTPAMADISDQFNSLSQIQELCRTSPSRVFHTTDAGARYDQRIVVDGVVYDLGLVGSGCYNEPLRIARLGEQVTWKDRYSTWPSTYLFKMENGLLVQYRQNTDGEIYRTPYASQCGSIKTYGVGRDRSVCSHTNFVF